MIYFIHTCKVLAVTFGLSTQIEGNCKRATKYYSNLSKEYQVSKACNITMAMMSEDNIDKELKLYGISKTYKGLNYIEFCNRLRNEVGRKK